MAVTISSAWSAGGGWMELAININIDGREDDLTDFRGTLPSIACLLEKPSKYLKNAVRRA